MAAATSGAGAGSLAFRLKFNFDALDARGPNFGWVNFKSNLYGMLGRLTSEQWYVHACVFTGKQK